MNKVDDMASVQSVKQVAGVKRKAVLSPELDEILHMLKSLEDELGDKQEPKRR